jgi:hypothetical protein
MKWARPARHKGAVLELVEVEPGCVPMMDGSDWLANRLPSSESLARVTPRWPGGIGQQQWCRTPGLNWGVSATARRLMRSGQRELHHSINNQFLSAIERVQRQTPEMAAQDNIAQRCQAGLVP